MVDKDELNQLNQVIAEYLAMSGSMANLPVTDPSSADVC